MVLLMSRRKDLKRKLEEVNHLKKSMVLLEGPVLVYLKPSRKRLVQKISSPVQNDSLVMHRFVADVWLLVDIPGSLLRQ